jgi:hypothetical protein
VPKELISRFVKICPTCQVRRGGLHLTPPNSRRGSPRLETSLLSPKHFSPPPHPSLYRRRSTYTLSGPSDRSQADCYANAHGAVDWTDGRAHLHSQVNISSGAFKPVTMPSACLLAEVASSTSSNSLVEDASASSTGVNCNSGNVRAHRSSRYHGY